MRTFGYVRLPMGVWLKCLSHFLRQAHVRPHGYSPARNVNVTSWARSRAPTFVIARTAWVFTVNGDTDICAAISWLSSPLATATTTSRSRGVKAEKR